MITVSMLLCALALQAAPSTRAEPPVRRPAAVAKPAVLEGVVADERGAPVANALVLVRLLNRDSAPALSLRTDSKGAFRQPLDRTGLVTVRVEADGLAPATLDRVRSDAPLRLTLLRGGAIHGVVRDGQSKEPLPDAVVQARQAGAVDALWEPRAGVVETRTDKSGRFSVAGLGAGAHTVSAVARGFGRAERPFVKVGSNIELFLFSGATLVGRIADQDGRPVAGASVWPSREGVFISQGALRPVVTDTQGSFEVAGLDSGVYSVVVVHRDHAPGVLFGIAVNRGEEVRADVTIVRGARLAGRLVDPERRPVAGAVEVVEIDGRPAPASARQLLRHETGGDGRFIMTHAPRAALALLVRAAGYAPQRVDASVGERDVDLGEVVLETGLAVRGLVRTRGALPVADANLDASPAPGSALSPSDSMPKTARSEADGTFVVAGLSSGSYRLRARAPGFSTANRVVEAGTDDVELTLDPAGTISGLVVDEAGRPVESFRVSARPKGAPQMSALAGMLAKSVDSADGRFTLEDATPGEYALEISAPELQAKTVPSFNVMEGSDTNVGRVVLSGGGIVRGTVVDTAGRAVLGASVVAEASTPLFGARPQASSGPAGEFELRGLAPGRVDVVASHPEYAEGRATGVEVDPAKEPSEVQVVMSLGGRIEGWARRRDGTPVAESSVAVFSLGPGGRPRFSNERMAPTRADGSFAFDRVPPGRASVRLMGGTGPVRVSSRSKDVEVREGETSLVEFLLRDILVGGRVTRAGAPLSDARVNMRPRQGTVFMVAGMAAGPSVPGAASGPERNAGLTREDGSFELLLDEPGTYAASVATLDGKLRLPSRNVEVPDADAFTLALDYAGATVAGLVQDKATEQPIAQASVVLQPRTRDAPGAASAMTGLDGRFVLEAEPGDYTLRVTAEGYSSAEREVSVSAQGLPEMSVAMTRGRAVTGKVVDAAGRGIGGIEVLAISSGTGSTPGFSGADRTLGDGTFTVGGLRDGPHVLLAQSTNRDTFALMPAVRSGQRDVILRLRAAARVTVQVTGADGQPIEGAQVSAVRIDGMRITIGSFASTDANGQLDLLLPAGALELEARKNPQIGRTSVTAGEGGEVSASVRLAESASPPER
jgi:hypothetical protein